MKSLQEEIFGHALHTRLTYKDVSEYTVAITRWTLVPWRLGVQNYWTATAPDAIGQKAGQPAFPEISLEPWPRTTGAQSCPVLLTDLLRLLPSGHPTSSRPCQPSIPSPVVALKNLGPFSCFATFSQVPKDSNSSGFFPKEMHFRKHGPFPSDLLIRTDCG